MAASADKVQYILETLLEESISLVKKGIFSQVELRDMMGRREKCENAMLKKTFKVTDYLGAIEYEYELERERRSRMDQLAKVEDGHSNPVFRKESSADFVIVKRIIKLWDRTMHKYKFKLHLWKQYIKFCITIGSKKHFYKALTNALRFLPFELDLWKIGVEYEKQVGHNLWKARKILIKGMKMVPAGQKNIQLGKYMIRFEVDFLKALLQRREIIIKGEQAMKFVGQEQQQQEYSDRQDRQAMDSIDLTQYDKMICIIIQQIFDKNRKDSVESLQVQSIRSELLNLLIELYSKNGNETIKDILLKTQNFLKAYQAPQVLEVKVENDILVQQMSQQQPQERNEYDNLAIGNTGDINIKVLQGLIKQRCLQPHALSQLYEQVLDLNFDQAVEYIINNRKISRLPTDTILSLLNRYHHLQDQEGYEHLAKFLQGQIDKTEAKDYRGNVNLLKEVVKFNSDQNRLQITTKIIRSLSIHFKAEPQFLETCNRISNAY